MFLRERGGDYTALSIYLIPLTGKKVKMANITLILSVLKIM
jgi:hypothetical protein